jgi:alkylation response protein AidB-like acyl-CoA dehydrogenase
VPATTELHQDLRHAVRDLCKAFPDSYWRELDARRADPDAFVKALTDAGYLAALIPDIRRLRARRRRSVGHPRGNQPQRRQRCACHAQMTRWGRCRLRLGGAETGVPAEDATGESRLQAFGVTEPRPDRTRRPRRWRRGRARITWSALDPRAEHSDLLLLVVRTTPIDQVKKRTDGLSILLVDSDRGRPRPDHPPDSHDDESRHDRAVFRRSRGAGGRAGRRRG